MRRVGLVLTVILGGLLVSSPAQAFAHNSVANPYLHTVLDGAILAALTTPLWVGYLWLRGRRRAGQLPAPR